MSIKQTEKTKKRVTQLPDVPTPEVTSETPSANTPFDNNIPQSDNVVNNRYMSDGSTFVYDNKESSADGAAGSLQAKQPIRQTDTTLSVSVPQDGGIVNNEKFVLKPVYRDRTREMAVLATNIYKKTGIKVQQAEMYTEDGRKVESFRGKYDGKNTIYVTPDATTAEVAQVILLHEMTHAIETTGEYEYISDYVLKKVYGENYSGNAQLGTDISNKIKEYGNFGIDLTTPKAQNEIVATKVQEAIFADDSEIQKIVNEDYTFGQKIYDLLGNIIYNIKSKFGMATETDRLEQARRKYRQALESVRKGNIGGNNGSFAMQNNVYDYTKTFAEQVDDWISGKIPQRDTLLIGGTPDVFKKIGLNSLPFTINQTHVDYAINGTKDFDHHIGEEMLKQLPQALENPVAIFQDTRNANVDNRLIALLKLTHNKKQVIMPVSIDGFGVLNGKEIDSNAIVSIFAKSNSIEGLLNDALSAEMYGNKSMFYWNKKEALSLLQRARVQYPRSLPQDGFIHSIRENDSFVNYRLENVTHSKQFKNWFGDWVNNPKKASKVVNEDGTPKIVYHGTRADFNIFVLQPEATFGRALGDGFYFTENYKRAFRYANGIKGIDHGGKIMSVYLNIKNPFYITDQNKTTYGRELNEGLASNKYDGIIDTRNGTYVVFNSNQIKSATDNIGTFDGNNPDIRYSMAENGDGSYMVETPESGDLKEELRKRWENRLKTEGLKPSENVTSEHVERYTEAMNNLLEIAKSKNLNLDTFYKEIEGKVDPDNLTYDGVKWSTIAMGNLFKGHLDENISRYIEMMHDAQLETSSEYTPYSELSDDKQAEFTQRINELNDKYTDLTPEEGEELAERLYEKFGKEKGRYIEPVNDISSPIYGERQQDALSELVSTLVGNNGYVFELRKNVKSVERAYSPTEKQMQYIEKIARGEADISDFSKDVGLDKLQPVIDAYKELYKAENDGIKGYRERTLKEYRTKIRNFLKNSNKWKDKLFGLQWYINTPERNARDTMGEDAEAFINEFVTPMKDNTAQGERYKTALVEKINSLNLSKEDFELVMKYGEGIYSDKDIPGVKLEMVRNAAKVFNEISEKIKDDVNASLVLNGYSPIDNPKIHLNAKETRIAMRALNGRISGNSIENQKIKQFINIAKRYGVDSIETDQRGRVFATVNIPYFPHGQIDDGVSALKKKLGLSDDVSELPGEITGRTEQFKPNKKWSGNLEHRNGQKTSYDIRNWRGYINDMAEIIYHTSDISKLRTLESELRNKYSENGEYFDSESTGAESLVGYDDLDKHNNLINWISEYANQIAGKKSSFDRGFERLVGRRIYNLVDSIQRNWAVNMIGGNISSAINQFSQMTNLISECNPWDILTATVDIATSNLEQARNDSSFLTSKKGTPILGMTTAERISEGMFYLTGKSENFTSMLVFQTKYNEMIRKRLSHQEAVDIADKYTAAVMADRTKAGLPVIFNSRNPIVKLFTTFQVEALNNLQHTFKDLPREARESKCFLWLVKCILAQWLAKYLFNKGKEKLTGSGSSEFEPITLGVTAYKAMAQKDGVTAEDVMEVLGNTAANLPGMQTVMALAGFDNAGQIPMTNMLPNIPELSEKIKEGDTSYIEDIGDTVVNAVNRFGGYNQIKKTVKGTKAVMDGGVYTKGGNLKYPVEQTPSNFVRGAVFGKSALPETKEYYNQKDRPKLSESEMDEYNYRTSNGENEQEVYDDLLQRKAEAAKEAEKNREYMEAAKEGINELDYGMKYEVENIYKRYKQIDPSATGIGCPQAEKTFSYNKEKYPLSPEEFAELQSRYNANYSFYAKPVINDTTLSDKEKYERLKNIRKRVRDSVNQEFYDEHYNTHGKSSYEILKGMANERRGKLPKAQNSETYQNNMNNTEQQSEAMNKLRQMIESDDAKRAEKTSLNYGIYKVTNNYGEYSNSHQAAHKGMDFAFDYGTPVQSPVSGRVVDIKSLNGSYGKYVVVEDNNGNYHYFAHLSGFNCEVGQQVGRGQTIAYSGNSGNSTGPHLHYEVRQGNDYNAQIDPRNYL